jgi:hypothetical protein
VAVLAAIANGSPAIALRAPLRLQPDNSDLHDRDSSPASATVAIEWPLP